MPFVRYRLWKLVLDTQGWGGPRTLYSLYPIFVFNLHNVTSLCPSQSLRSCTVLPLPVRDWLVSPRRSLCLSAVEDVWSAVSWTTRSSFLVRFRPWKNKNLSWNLYDETFFTRSEVTSWLPITRLLTVLQWLEKPNIYKTFSFSVHKKN